MLAKLIFTILLKGAVKSWTGRLATAITAAGATVAIDPELLGMIPTQYQGYVLGAIGVCVLVARNRQEIAAKWAQIKAEISAP